MGRTEKRELISRLTVLLLHLLKWRYQPGKRGAELGSEHSRPAQPACRSSRRQPEPEAAAAAGAGVAYRNARLEAVAETGLPEATFPEACPWTVEQALDGGFWPE